MNTVAPTLQHGRRNRDSGRIFIVVYYQKQYHFGKPSNTDIKKTRIKNLKIHNPFEQTIPINVFALTFNAGNCKISDLETSLPQFIPSNGSIDLYVLAFQELHTKKNKDKKGNNNKGKEESIFDDDEKKGSEANIGDTHHEKGDNQQTQIVNTLLDHIGENEYDIIAHYKMWQTRLFLFAKNQYTEKISNVTSHFHTTGIGGIVKNKGAVAISLEFDGVSLCFLSCHLAAHQTKCDDRNKMYKKLCKNIKVGWPKQPLLGQFHFLFFMGDLNYRVDYFGKQQSDKPTDELFQNVCQILKQITISSSKSKQQQRKQNVDKSQITGGGTLKQESPYAGILKNDQLKASMESGKAFWRFKEHHIKFPPSFKVCSFFWS